MLEGAFGSAPAVRRVCAISECRPRTAARRQVSLVKPMTASKLTGLILRSELDSYNNMRNML